MISPAQVRDKAARHYMRFLEAYLAGKDFFPLELPFPKVKASDDYMAVKAGVQTLLLGAKREKGYGYSVAIETRTMRRYGPQSLPSRIWIETETDFLKLTGKEVEFKRFKDAVRETRRDVPQLFGWVEAHPKEVLRHLDKWAGLLKVCRYFLEQPRPNLYTRELPIAVHSKFVEENRGILSKLLEHVLPPNAVNEHETLFEKRFHLRYKEALIRFRVLDDQLVKRYALPVRDLSTPVSQFASLNLSSHPFVMTENEMTFLTLPTLPNSFGLFGKGFAVEALASVTWLEKCPILYWGDLDAHGFQILSQLRGYFLNVVSLMMDEVTLRTFGAFKVAGTTSKVMALPNLTPDEARVFDLLVEGEVRLEQERISHGYAVRELRRSYRALNLAR